MDTINDTPVDRKNKHLSAFERGEIASLLKEGYSAYAIAKKLRRAYNTVRAELDRGTVTQIKNDQEVKIYYPDTGQLTYERNRENSTKQYKLLQVRAFIKHVVRQFKKNKHSIDAIVGQARKLGLFAPSEMVCTKTLYNYIDLGLLEIINLDLPLKVRRSSKPAHVRKNKRKLGTSIEERPEHINDRSEFGHWEIDTVIGKKTAGEPVLLTLTERQTRYELIIKVPSKTANAVMEALEELTITFGAFTPKVFKSITSDNGAEFSDLASLEEHIRTSVYFAHPYTSGERGTNERHNGMIRRFIPKGKSMNDYSAEYIAWIELWCNTLPRKILGYSTPEEAFVKQLGLLGCS